MTTKKGDMHALRTAPDQLILLFPHETPDAERVVAKALNGSGYSTDQTDVWVTLEISGPDTTAALERLCPLDLLQPQFPVGAFARTVMEHMGVMILRIGREDFMLFAASSSANSFLHSVETSYRNVTG